MKKNYNNQFVDFSDFVKKIKSIKRDEWADWIKVGDDWYTIENYDQEGEEMDFTSITACQSFCIHTSNRYGDTWLTDAEIETYEPEYFRFTPDYYLLPQEVKTLDLTARKKLIRTLFKYWEKDKVMDYLIEAI